MEEREKMAGMQQVCIPRLIHNIVGIVNHFTPPVENCKFSIRVQVHIRSICIIVKTGAM